MNRSELKSLMHAVYHRCLRLLKDPARAEDALQEVMLRFFQKNKEKTIHEPLRYLYRSSTNHCLNLLRSHRRQAELLKEHRESSFEQARLTFPDASVGVRELLEEFGEEATLLLVFRYLDQMTLQELGEMYGITDRGVKKRLDKLESRVRQHFLGKEP
jgi:RNA polymerase sigma-70 factor (ECF subfamily)